MPRTGASVWDQNQTAPFVMRVGDRLRGSSEVRTGFAEDSVTCGRLVVV